MPRRVAAILAVVATAALFACTWAGWVRNPNGIWGLYTLTDGALAAWNSWSIFQWSAAFDPAPYNFLQGLGSFYLTNTPWLNPGALLMSLPLKTGALYALSYSVYWLELLLSMILLARAIGLTTLQGVIAGQLICLFLFPPFSGYFVSLAWISLAPFNAHLFAVCNLLLAAFVRLGYAKSQAGNLALTAAILGLLACAFFSSEVTIITFMPAYGAAALAALTCNPERKALAWKLCLFLVVAGAALLLRLPDYYFGVSRVSAAHLSAQSPESLDLAAALGRLFHTAIRNLDWCNYPQVFVCSKYPVGAIHVGSLAGAAIVAAAGRGLLRRLAFAVLVYTLLVYVYSIGAHAQVLGLFSRINKDYLLFASYPFQVLLLVAGAFSLMRLILHKLPPRGPGVESPLLALEIAFLFAVPAFAAWLLLSRVSGESKGVYVPLANPVTSDLIRELSVAPGTAFRGRVTSYFGSRQGPLRERLGIAAESSTLTNVYVDSRHYLHAAYGNSFMMTDLWRFDIPTLEEYGQWVTKPLYLFTQSLFGGPADWSPSWEPNIHMLRIPILQMIGVRFIITDAELDDARLVLRRTHVASGPPPRPEIAGFAAAGKKILEGPPIPVRLYEIWDANLGSYSPVHVLRAGSGKKALSALADPAFSPRVDVVLEDEIPVGALRPATDTKMIVQKGGIHISARSSGESMLLLPVQFTNCMRIRPVGAPNPGAEPRLIRANLLQTAVVFTNALDTSVVVEYGLGSKVDCRLRDVADYQKLGLGLGG